MCFPLSTEKKLLFKVANLSSDLHSDVFASTESEAILYWIAKHFVNHVWVNCGAEKDDNGRFIFDLMVKVREANRQEINNIDAAFDFRLLKEGNSLQWKGLIKTRYRQGLLNPSLNLKDYTLPFQYWSNGYKIKLAGRKLIIKEKFIPIQYAFREKVERKWEV